MEKQIAVQTRKQNGVSILPPSLDSVQTGRLDDTSLTPAIAFNTPSMASMVKQHRENIYTSIELLLAQLEMSVNIGKNINEDQLAGIAKAIYSRYYKFSIEEVALVLRKGRQGDFGKLYDRLDEMIIMEWFEKYDCSGEREALVQNARINSMKEGRQEYNEVISKIMERPEIKKMAQELIKKSEEETNKESNYQEFRKQYLLKKQQA